MPHKIIIAHQSISVLKAMEMAFHNSECQLQVFQDGIEAETAIKNFSPDVLILGLHLSGRDGYSIASEIRNTETMKHIPVIMIQGAFEPLEEEWLLEISPVEIYRVPFDSGHLVQKVQAILNQQIEPQTFPESPIPGEKSPLETEEETPQRIREFVKKEVFEMERELEKRLRTQILTEIKGSEDPGDSVKPLGDEKTDFCEE